jgi:carboxypeptidase Q
MMEPINSLNSKLRISVAALLVAAMVAPAPLLAATPDENQPDLLMISRIREEGFHHSKVMEIESELTDRLGPRLSGSANLKRANEWTRDALGSYGLQNAHLEGYDFGRGWALDSVSVRMTAPTVAQLVALPKAWTPSTEGDVKGEVVQMKATTAEELDAYRGKLAGKIVLVGTMRDIQPGSEPLLNRYDDAKLKELEAYSFPNAAGRNIEEFRKRFMFQRALDKFLAEEKPAVTIEASRGQSGVLFVQGTQNYKLDSQNGVPQLVMSVENFGRIYRLLERKVPVTLDVNVQSHFETPDGGKIFNTVAEIPGTDKKDEIVMVGGHLDSWHAGTGATDNAAGCAVAMEAVRILQRLGVKPRRTIRIALWSGEEEGLLGSRAYAAQHFGKREEAKPNPADAGLPSFLREPVNLPLHLMPEQTKVSAYFNVDNGTGKLRGIYTQENSAVVPIFNAWGAPFRDLGFTTVTNRNTGGTDHLSFDAVGIPGFQFIQDSVEYETLTHHSNMDVYERIQRDDMMQAAVIEASFVYDAAMRDEMMPRKDFPVDTKVVKDGDNKPSDDQKAPEKKSKKK